MLLKNCACASKEDKQFTINAQCATFSILALSVRFEQRKRYMIIDKRSAKISDFVTNLSALFGNLLPLFVRRSPIMIKEEVRLLILMKE